MCVLLRITVFSSVFACSQGNNPTRVNQGEHQRYFGLLFMLLVLVNTGYRAYRRCTSFFCLVALLFVLATYPVRGVLKHCARRLVEVPLQRVFCFGRRSCYR